MKYSVYAAYKHVSRIILGIPRYCVDLRFHHRVLNGSVIMSANNQASWAQKNIKTYLLGLLLCLILTSLSFGIVHTSTLDKEMIYVLLTLFALAQLLIQSVCFLGLKTNTAGQWNLLPFLFTILIIVFLVGGSLWIMYNLNVLMMSGTMGV